MKFFSDEKFDFFTHLLFPARTLIKELIYWPTELAAAIIFFIYIVQMDVEYTTADVGGEKIEYGKIKTDKSATSTLEPFGSNIQMMPTNLLAYEYAWICLCYMIKHALYLVDFIILLRHKYCKPYDLAAPVLNLGMWTLWGIYGWTESGFQIFGGVFLRAQKDTIYFKTPGLSDDAKDAAYAPYLQKYQDNMPWRWLWIPLAAVFVFNAALYILGFIQKRSSAFTGQALSTLFIPTQLFFFHLFLKGSWIRSNTADDSVSYDLKTANGYRDSLKAAESYEARWVFFVIYLMAYAGGVAGLLCVVKAVFSFRSQNTLGGIKYICYFIFWGSALIWVLFLDNTLFHTYVFWKTGLIVTHIICMAMALFIWIISALEKKKEGDKFYIRHQNLYESFKNGQVNPHQIVNAESKEAPNSIKQNELAYQPRPYKK